MREAGWVGEDEGVREAWFVLMLRAFCWWRCHYMVGFGEQGGRVEQGVEVGRVPARFWGSEMRVFVE